ncbi:hypothetical protein GCM10023258_31160 [Terrabacter aeriphilus]|uniref:Uncharacterized protein n=1 Tax=Terrabacter aeriphilus TaxID=515662 RepID=A0ABP9JJM3_9MICO
MSHPAEAAHDPPGPVAGAQALPTPTGRPEELRSGARAVARVAARARATPTLRGELAPRLGAVWTGDAATAAVDEAAALAGRARAVVDALPAAAHALLAYAGTLEGVIARVRSVQRRWDAADEAHERAVAALTGGAAPVTGPLVEEHRRRLDDEHRAARARLRRAHEEELDLLRSAGLRCASAIAAATDRTLPWPLDPTATRVRGAVTGGLPFADGVVAARDARESALGDAAALRRVLGGPPDAAASAALSARLRAHRGDALHAQALLAELGANGLGAAVTELTAAGPATDVDAVREVLGLLGSLLVSAMQPLTARLPAAGQPVAGQPVTDPRTRDQLASGAALLADELVAGLGTVHTGAGGRSRAVGGWLLGQLLVGARASGDRRPLPARFVRRAAAAVAAAEVAETRDDDVGLRRGTTLRPDGSDVFASWFADADRTGDALHVVLGEVTDEPGAAAALLAEPLPDVGGLGAALANSRGDRLTVGEHLVRRWVVVEAGGTETHHGLQLATDDDLDRLLTGLTGLAASSAAPATAAVATGGVGPGLAAAVRARLVLEVSRTSAHAVREASSTALYAAGTATLEPTVVTWLAAMRANVDRALAAPPGTIDHGAYVAPTANGPQPLLDADELAGVVAALAVETGTGLHARDPASAYDLLLDGELAATRRSLSQGGSPAADLARLGFLDRAAAAALVDVARAQDELDRAAWQGLAEAKGVALALRVDPVAGLRTVIGTYATGGTMRTAADDLAVAVVCSDVELDQTLRDDGRRLALVGRVLALPGIGPVASVTAALDRGAARAPALPTAPQLRAAREAEIRAAWDALRDEGSLRRVEDAARRGAARDPGRLGVAAGRDGRLPELDRLPRGRSSTTKLVESEAQLRTLLRDLTRGAKRVDAGHYPGLRFLRPDGVEVRFREASTSGGATIDLTFSDGTWKKVHIR